MEGTDSGFRPYCCIQYNCPDTRRTKVAISRADLQLLLRYVESQVSLRHPCSGVKVSLGPRGLHGGTVALAAVVRAKELSSLPPTHRRRGAGVQGRICSPSSLPGACQLHGDGVHFSARQ